ncbi:MAG: hypothetical protein HQ483_18390 [Rhodospirillales bacterium]|nr:hypothetical protein [Rhodospirillales bacterium]
MSFGFLSGIAQVIASAFSVYNAIDARSENKRVAKEVRASADRQAARKQTELEHLRSLQRVAYAKAGVKLSGTPTIVIDESQAQGQMDIEAIKLKGLQQARAYDAKAAQAGMDAGIKLVSRFKI